MFVDHYTGDYLADTLRSLTRASVDKRGCVAELDTDAAIPDALAEQAAESLATYMKRHAGGILGDDGNLDGALVRNVRPLADLLSRLLATEKLDLGRPEVLYAILRQLHPDYQPEWSREQRGPTKIMQHPEQVAWLVGAMLRLDGSAPLPIMERRQYAGNATGINPSQLNEPSDSDNSSRNIHNFRRTYIDFIVNQLGKPEIRRQAVEAAVRAAHTPPQQQPSAEQPTAPGAQPVSKPWTIVILAGAAIIGVVVIVLVSIWPRPEARVSAQAGPSVEPIALPNLTGVPASKEWSPLAVVNVSPLTMIPGDVDFALEEPLQADPATFVGKTPNELAEQFHGIAVDKGITTFTVRNTVNEAIRIIRLSVQKNCGAPYTGTFFSGGKQGNAEANVKIGVNLDAATPIIQQMYDTSSVRLAGPDYFTENTVSLSPGDTQTFTLGAITKRYSCTFTLRLYTATSRGTVYNDISAGNSPFVITASAYTGSKSDCSNYKVSFEQHLDLTWSRPDRKACK